MNVPYNYLNRQFDEESIEVILGKIRELARTGDFTIGAAVVECERRLAARIGVPNVIGTNTGTDALILAMKALGIGQGDEVITQVNTFYATAGAIVAVGAKPVFVDVDALYAIDETKIEAAITAHTKAILPVHWGGLPPDMDAICAIAEKRSLFVVEDACPAVGAAYRGRPAGSFGHAAAFSMHPLKPLHVWGDGGAVVMKDEKAAEWLRLYRNHGMTCRDEIAIWGINQRLQSIQAVVANHVLDSVDGWIDTRIRIAERIFTGLEDVPEITVPPRPAERRNAYQLTMVRAKRRTELIASMAAQGIELKIHYPTPLHLQPAARSLGYARGDFPVAEAQAADLVTLPAHQYLKDAEADFMIERIRAFYGHDRYHRAPK